MFCSKASWALSFLLFDASLVLGRTLVPIHPHGPAHNRRSAEPKDLELRSIETFLWGDEGIDVPIANLTLDMPGDTENILSMERFDGMLTAVECGADKLQLTFEDDATFAYAQKVWDWVNGADNHSFVMVAGPGDCGNNEDRVPYVISTLLYDEVANRATLGAKETTWEEIAHTYDLVIGGVSGQDAPNAPPKLPKRNIDKSTSIDFVHDLPFSVALSANGLSASLACTNCSTSGAFDLEFTIRQKFFVPTGASMKLKPRDVAAIAQIKLTGSGQLTDALTKEFQIVQIPISAFTIPGVFDLGPFLTVSVGAEISSLTLSAGVTTGAKASFSNDAILELDLLEPEKNTFSGWEPAVDPIDLKVDASISGGVAVFLKPALELQAEALGHGFSVGINMKVPNVNAKLAAIAAPEGACPATDGQPKTPFGVKASFNIGGSINFAFKKTGDSKPIFTVQLAAIDKPLASTCFPFGDPIKARSMSPAPAFRGATRRAISA